MSKTRSRAKRKARTFEFQLVFKNGHFHVVNETSIQVCDMLYGPFERYFSELNHDWSSVIRKNRESGRKAKRRADREAIREGLCDLREDEERDLQELRDWEDALNESIWGGFDFHPYEPDSSYWDGWG